MLTLFRLKRSHSYLVEYVVKPLLKAKPDQAAIDVESPRMHRLCKILDDQLAKHSCITGDNITIADIAIASPMHLYAQSRLPFENYPNLLRWQQEQMEGNKAWMETQKAVNILVPGCSDGIKGNDAANGITDGAAKSVKSTFMYTKDIPDDPPTIFFYEDPKGEKARAPGDDAVEQTIHDGWDRVSEFSIDKQGFALKDFVSKFEDWEDPKAVQEQFYPEVDAFLKKETGASRVLIFDHTLRAARNENKKLTQETDTSQRAPVMLVHCDYTAQSGPLRIKQLLPEEADTLLQGRCAFINVWKPVRRVVEERPLAMCDVTTSPDADFMKLFLHYRDRIGENYVMRKSDSQKWYYFPKMHPDQSILLKTYDSATDGTARFVGHTAVSSDATCTSLRFADLVSQFIDPTSPPNAPMRESCEVRTICFF